MSHSNERNRVKPRVPNTTYSPRHLSPPSSTYRNGAANQYGHKYNPQIPLPRSQSSTHQGLPIPRVDFTVPPPNYRPSSSVVQSDDQRTHYGRSSYSRRDASPTRYSRREQREEKCSSFSPKRPHLEERPSDQKRSSNQYRRENHQRGSTETPYSRESTHRDRNNTRRTDTWSSSQSSSSRTALKSSRSPPTRRSEQIRKRRSSSQCVVVTPPRQNTSSRSHRSAGRRRSPVHGPSGLTHTETERDRLLNKWRSNYCETPDDIADKLAELDDELESSVWIRSSPADIYYKRASAKEVEALPRLGTLCDLFSKTLISRGIDARAKREACEPTPRKKKHRLCRHRTENCSSSDSSDIDMDIDDECPMEELTRKINHPLRVHPDLWHNEGGEMNDGPLCGCSVRSRRSGIRHGIYPGEIRDTACRPISNNVDKLYHYRITISPPTNFLTKTPTIIKHDEHEFIFEGFSLFSHEPIGELPTCKVIRFNIQYTVMYIEEQAPENFTIRELDLFYNYFFVELLELLDFSLLPNGEGETCPRFHFLPRFVRDLQDNGKEVLAMCEVLRYLLDSAAPLVSQPVLENLAEMTQEAWQDYVDYVKEMVVTYPGMKPCSVRVDQLDRNVSDIPECVDPINSKIVHPVIVHFGIRPPQLSYAGNPEYQKLWREYVKFRHLIANMSKPSFDDKRKLEVKEMRLQEMRTQGRMKRNVTVAVSSKGFFRTGIMCDMVQHAMLIPVLTSHVRFHKSLDVLENIIEYKFKNRFLLQLALTHPSYKENFGTNPDHARNSLTNCGIRQPEYGDRKIHYMNTRKRGINTLINIMSRFGRERETDSNITHNERLEFLGDAVVEFLTSIHLFFLFPDLEEGGLATYRAAVVQNQHLAVLAKKLRLDEFMLYAHGSDLCHQLELRHAMANCFEALMGSLLLDGGIDVADKVFSKALFQEDTTLLETWLNYPPHPLQEQEPFGDRKWIESYQTLQDLTEFESQIGTHFTHIRLLARAFTDRSIGFTNLTLGSNQRLEFLGDTVLQLICSEYLYLHFPEHHEGHLSLLRSSLVNNRTQAVVCDDLGMTKFAMYANPKGDLKTKDRADLLEAFLGALYVDQGLECCETFCQVCLFPRLQIFIMNQDWNDPKSKLQQCCLTLRTMDGGEPDIPVYKVVECLGPTNTRVYTVAVYFRGKRLATADGHSIQQAEMKAAEVALENSRELFPQLDYQKRVITQSIKRQKGDDYVNKSSNDICRKEKYRLNDNASNLPKQYRVPDELPICDYISSSEESSINEGSVIEGKQIYWKTKEQTDSTVNDTISDVDSPDNSVSEIRLHSIKQGFDNMSEDVMSDVSSKESGEIDDI